MPRVKELNHTYKAKDITAYIVGQMKVQGITQAEMAQEIGVSQQDFSYKVNNHRYKLEDLLLIFRRLGTSNDDILRFMKL